MITQTIEEQRKLGKKSIKNYSEIIKTKKEEVKQKHPVIKELEERGLFQ